MQALIKLTKADGYDLLINFRFLQHIEEGDMGAKNKGVSAYVVLANGERHGVRERVETIIERFMEVSTRE